MAAHLITAAKTPLCFRCCSHRRTPCNAPTPARGSLVSTSGIGPPLRCSAPTSAPAIRCGRRRLGSALTAASGDSSSEHDRSPGSLPVAGSPVATPAALPRSRRRRLLPPLPACRLRSAPAPARWPVPLDPEGDAQTPLGCRCSLSLHRSRIRSERSLSPVGCLIVAPAPAGGRRRERLRPSAPQGIARCAALHLARRC